MSQTKYFGEIEFIKAITSIQNELEEASSFEEAIPCRADASFTNEDSQVIPAAIAIDKYESKHRPGLSYYIQLEAKLASHRFEEILTTGTKDEIAGWLAEKSNYDSATKLLFKTYRSAWQTEDSMRFRDW